nr:MAG TPA: hypothetical protein [Bacteriophage sp.]
MFSVLLARAWSNDNENIHLTPTYPLIQGVGRLRLCLPL